MCLAPHIFQMAKDNTKNNKKAAAPKRGVKKKIVKIKNATIKQRPYSLRSSNNSQTINSHVMLAAVDATRLVHIPPHIPLGPYTVVRGRTIIPVTTNIAAQDQVLLLGQYGLNSQFNSACTSLIGILGVGGNVPGTAETQYLDSILTTFDAAAPAAALTNASLHALTVTISCVSTATTAVGLIYYGAVNQRINRQQFPFWNSVATSLTTRREMSSVSAYNCLAVDHKLSAYPVDVVDWASQRPVLVPSATLGDNIAMDSLSQLAIVFPSTATAVQYVITVHTEWRVNFPDPALASTSGKRDPASPVFWNKVMDVGSQLGGKFDMSAVANGLSAGANVLASGMNAFATVRGAYNELGAIGKMASFA